MPQNMVHVFVFDTMADWEFGFAVAGINSPRFQLHPGYFGVQTVGLGKAAARTMGGVNILPDGDIEELDPTKSAMLILPGGLIWDEGGNREAVEVAKRFLAAGVPVAAICGATAGLAKAGMLDDRRHTSNSLDYLKATGYRGESFYENQPAVTDKNVITASGIAPLEFARHIFEKLGIYSAEKLEAWYALFKTGDLSRFEVLAR